MKVVAVTGLIPLLALSGCGRSLPPPREFELVAPARGQANGTANIRLETSEQPDGDEQTVATLDMKLGALPALEGEQYLAIWFTKANKRSARFHWGDIDRVGVEQGRATVTGRHVILRHTEPLIDILRNDPLLVVTLEQRRPGRPLVEESDPQGPIVLVTKRSSIVLDKG